MGVKVSQDKDREDEFCGIRLGYGGGKLRFFQSKLMGLSSQWKPLDLCADSKVYLSQVVKRRNKQSYSEYYVGLETGEQKIEFGQVRGDIHGIAESVAKFLDLGMVDRSRGKAVERAAGTLDDSLREQAAKAGLPLYLPCRPERPKVLFRITDEIEEFSSFRMQVTNLASKLSLRSDLDSASVELRGGFESNDWIVATARYMLSEQPDRIDWETLRSWSQTQH